MILRSMCHVCMIRQVQALEDKKMELQTSRSTVGGQLTHAHHASPLSPYSWPQLVWPISISKI